MASRLRIYFQADTTTVERATLSAEAGLTRLSEGVKRDDSALRSESIARDRLAAKHRALGSSLGGAAKAAIGAAVAFVGIAQAKTAITSTDDLAKATLSLSKNLGMATRTASEWAAVAHVRGVDSTKLGMAFKTLSSQVVAARDGSAAATAEFKRLGFTQREITKGAANTTFLVKGVADGLNGMAAGADKASISGKLFGRGWATVQPLLRDGSAELQKSLDLANHYGAAFGGKDLKSIEDMIQAERELALAQIGVQVQFTEKLAPALVKLGLGLAGFINDMRRGKGVAGELANTLADIWGVLKVLASDIYFLTKNRIYVFLALLGAISWLDAIVLAIVGVKVGFKELGSAISAGAKFVSGVFGGLGKGVSTIGHGIGGALGAIGSVFSSIANFIGNVLGSATDAFGSASIPTITVSFAKLEKNVSGAAAGVSAGARNVTHHQRGGPVQRLQSGGAVWRGVPPTGLQPGIRSATSQLLSRFPGLTVTSTISGGHAAGSYHYKGEATDTAGSSSVMSAASDWIKSSGLYRSLVEGIHNPNLSVSQGQLVSPGFWGSTVWAEHANHIHMAVTRSVGPVSIPRVPAITIHGAGPLGGLAQALADRMRAAANRYLARSAPATSVATTTTAHGSGTLSVAQFIAVANQAIALTGERSFTAGGLLALALQESSLQVNPTPPNDINTQQGNPSMGLMQITGTNFSTYHQPGTSTNIVDPLANICASINYQVARYGHQVTFSPYKQGGVVGNAPWTQPFPDTDLEDALRENIQKRAALGASALGDAMAVLVSG